MRIIIFEILTSLSASTSAFVPSLRSERSAAFRLHARYTPPPPPPGKGEDIFDSLLRKITSDGSIGTDVSTDGGNFVDGLLRDLSSRLGKGVSLPPLPDRLPEVSFNGGLQDLRQQFQELDQSVISAVDEMAKRVQDGVMTDYPNLAPYLDRLKTLLAPALQSPSLTLLVSALLTYTVVSSILSWDRGPPPSQPYPAGKYDPIAARAYFDNKWHSVVGRGLEILVQSLRFGLRLVQDKLNNNVEITEFQRGKELAELLTRLGPTFIKGEVFFCLFVFGRRRFSQPGMARRCGLSFCFFCTLPVGQSLSIRTDLLSPAYIRGLSTLQDQVPPFETSVARQILEAEWGRPVEAVLEKMPAEPVAAASLGQVYKAKLKSTGQEVAIKVQRPNIMTQIALDMHLLREIAPIVKRFGNLNSDTVGTVDAWGTGFVDELDYLAEAQNAIYFNEKIKETSLGSVVFAPSTVDEYSTGSVLVTQWIDGQRLDQSSASDVTVLCSIAMNT